MKIDVNKILVILKKIVVVFLSIISVISLNIQIDKNLEFWDSIYGNNIMFVAEFILIAHILNEVLKYKDKRLNVIITILSSIFSMFSVIGSSINIYGNLDAIVFSSDTLIKSIIKIIGTGTIFFIIINIIFKYINKINNKNIKKENKSKIEKKFGIISFIFIIICWIPYFLTYYPGIITGDSIDQINQTIGINMLNAHHPLIHTSIIYIGINLGKLIGNYNLGVAIYTLLQMGIMASIFSYTIYYMKKIKISNIFIVITLLFYSIYPINPLFSLMMWKDVIFAGLMLLFIINTHKYIVKNEEKINKKDVFIYVLNIIILMLFRNNGIYVILLTTPFIFLLNNKCRKKLFLIILTSLIIYFGINVIVTNVLKIPKGQVKEALSIPMQQFARVMKYNKDEITEEEKQLIFKFIPNEKIDEIYNPYLSDPVKNCFDSKAFSNNKFEFIGLWCKICFKYPRTCVESFLCNSYGYWYPEAQSWVANRDMESNNLNIYQDSKIKGKIVRKIDSFIEKRQNPLVSMMFSIGFIFWCILLCMTYCIYKKQYKMILIYIPILILWLTTLASPVFCEFRYVYSFVTCLPFVGATIFINKN